MRIRIKYTKTNILKTDILFKREKRFARSQEFTLCEIKSKAFLRSKEKGGLPYLDSRGKRGSSMLVGE
jgi:hypothetical protein